MARQASLVPNVLQLGRTVGHAVAVASSQVTPSSVPLSFASGRNYYVDHGLCILDECS